MIGTNTPNGRNGDGGCSTPMVGLHPIMQRLRESLVRAAPLDAPVLIHGPTGSGKELAAELLHTCSGRKGALVPVNVAALPEHLIESELFGSARGAFTGAHIDRGGLIEEAAGGTLYLDEAAELSVAVQAKLLRVLDAGIVRRVGATKHRRISFRLVLSLQQPAQTLVTSGRWREDFYYRVASIALQVPRLADHASDVPLLIDHFLERLGRPPLGPPRSEALLRYLWPGNVREVRRCVEQAVFLAGDGQVTEPLLVAALSTWEAPSTPERPSGQRSLREVEREHIEAVLRDTRFDSAAAAAVLGVSHRSLYRRFDALGIVPPRQRSHRVK